ncbi:hypothetical protein ACJJTC_010333 [Scirpophaga incertulas]
MSNLVNIDGSLLEGGGQILRISISLSAILGVPVRVFNIRAKRSKPGLAAQHLKGIQLVADMCKAKLKGANIGSTDIEFVPSKINGGRYVADTRTAGSISLLLQVSLPCALMASSPVSLELRGGTNADMAPQVDYLPTVFQPILKRFNADFQLNIRKRGYFPKGGGVVTAEVRPVRGFSAVQLTDRGDIVAVRGSAFVAGNLPLKLAQEMAEGAKSELRSIHANLDIQCYREDRTVAPDSCSGISVWGVTSTGCVLGGDGLGRRGLDPRDVGRAAAAALLRDLHSRACLDTHAQDQAIVYMALAGGKSSVRVGEVTLHTKTAIYIAELIAKVKFSIQEDGDSNIIECTGLGYVNKNLAD